MEARRLAPLLLLALGALAAAPAAAAGPVSSPTYSCDPAACRPSGCLCASNAPPGGLRPDQIPQFVLISHDNALDDMPFNLMQRILGDTRQANGCRVPVTWFAQRYHSNCTAGQQAHAQGDEVAMQANRFPPADPFVAPIDTNPNYDTRDPATGQPSLEVEITLSRKRWNEDCGIPLHDMVGFRAQDFYNNPPSRQALSKNGWLYDSSIIEWVYNFSPTSPSANEMLWPYSMDAGIPQDCGFLGPEVGKCSPNETYAGLWEVPLYALQDEQTIYGINGYGDTELEGVPPVDDLAALFRSQLDARLAGGRAPLALNTYYEYLSEKPPSSCKTELDPYCFQVVRELSRAGEALADLVAYGASRPEVRFVTYSDLIRWMQDPVPLDQFDSWVQCGVPGVKADLSAVNLSPAAKAGAFYLTQGGAGAGAPAPAPAELGALVQGAPGPAAAELGALVEGAPGPDSAPEQLGGAPSPAAAPAPAPAARRLLR